METLEDVAELGRTLVMKCRIMFDPAEDLHKDIDDEHVIDRIESLINDCYRICGDHAVLIRRVMFHPDLRPFSGPDDPAKHMNFVEMESDDIVSKALGIRMVCDGGEGSYIMRCHMEIDDNWAGAES